MIYSMVNKNTNKKIAIFISLITVSFFFLFGHFFSSLMDNSSISVESNKNDLSFVDMQSGSGIEATYGSNVTINFVLRTPSGETVASSLYSGPLTFTIGKQDILSGLDRTIVGMKVSGKRVIVIPPMYVYAYSDSNPVTSDKPLVFEVELLSIN